MPETNQEYLWWALNGAIAVIIFLARMDLKEMKSDIKTALAKQAIIELAIAEMKAKCPKWEYSPRPKTDLISGNGEDC